LIIPSASAPATQVQVAVAHAQLLARLRIVADDERSRLGLGEHLEAVDVHLDRAGHALLVDLVGVACRDLPRHGDHVLESELLGSLDELGRRATLRVEQELRHAVAVAQVDEHEVPEVAQVLDPAVEHDRTTDVLELQLAAGVGALEETGGRNGGLGGGHRDRRGEGRGGRAGPRTGKGRAL
jgi:hypothetical protein